MNKALTLAELMVAAAVLTLICLMLYLLFANCIILNEFNRNRTRALTHAEYVLEEIKNQTFTGLEDRINVNNEWDWDAAWIEKGGLSVLETEAIDTSETGADPDLLDVVVSVSWLSRGGASQSISLETLIAEP